MSESSAAPFRCVGGAVWAGVGGAVWACVGGGGFVGGAHRRRCRLGTKTVVVGIVDVDVVLLAVPIGTSGGLS